MSRQRKSARPEPEMDPDKEAKLLEYVNDERHFSLIRALHLADLITEMNCFCGVMSVFASMKYCLGRPHDLGWLWMAMGLMPFGLMFDFLDGKVARWRRKSSLMGQELDSLADLVSFGVAPAACSFAWGLRSFLDCLILGCFVLCGLSRLARFNVSVSNVPKDKSGKAKYFEGTPIPTTLSLIATLAFFTYQGKYLDSVPLGVFAQDTWVEIHPAVGMFVLSGIAMTSKSLKIPKYTSHCWLC